MNRISNYGEVYTRHWVVEFVLNLAGYSADANLVDAVAIEPAAGRGAFVELMAERLIMSCRKQGRPLSDCKSSINAYERDANSAAHARRAVIRKLIGLNVPISSAEQLARSWIKTADYLLEFGKRIESTRILGEVAYESSTLARADYVIGNPPYIRLEEIPENNNSIYRTLFKTMKGRSDIYVAFYEAALRELKNGGVCAYICADRWMLNQYGTELRRLITSGYSVEVIIEMHRAEAFESEVSAYPAITVIRRAHQSGAVVGNANGDAERLDASELSAQLHKFMQNRDDALQMPGIQLSRIESWFRSTEPWIRTSPERLRLLRKLEREFMHLESESTGTRIGIGVATGLDEVYITSDATVVEPDRLLPLALTEDIQSGSTHWAGHYLINPWSANGLVDLEQYPKLSSYLLKFRQRIRRRSIAKRSEASWYRTIDRVDLGLLHETKLYIPDIKSVIHPVLDNGKTYPHHNLYFVVSRQWDLEILGALLMSEVGKFFVECYGVRMRGGYLRMQAQYLRRICVPHPHSIGTNEALALRTAFRARDTETATRVALDLYGIDHFPQ